MDAREVQLRTFLLSSLVVIDTQSWALDPRTGESRRLS